MDFLKSKIIYAMLMMSVIGLSTGLSSFERTWKRFSTRNPRTTQSELVRSFINCLFWFRLILGFKILVLVRLSPECSIFLWPGIRSGLAQWSRDSTICSLVIVLKQKKFFWAVGMYEYLHKCLLLQEFQERSKSRKTFKPLVQI